MKITKRLKEIGKAIMEGQILEDNLTDHITIEEYCSYKTQIKRIFSFKKLYQKAQKDFELGKTNFKPTKWRWE